jgi:hypothetical protein
VRGPVRPNKRGVLGRWSGCSTNSTRRWPVAAEYEHRHRMLRKGKRIVKFVVASTSERWISDASRLLGALPQVELRVGPASDVGVGCDAEILHYTVAHDLYGGRPVVGRAQVLRNLRGDGSPPVILATPPLEAGAGIGPDGQVEAENHAVRMLRMALDEWAASSDFIGRTARCLLHVEGAGLDFGEVHEIVAAIRRVAMDYTESA